MKKIIFLALALLVIFTVNANAAGPFSVESPALHQDGRLADAQVFSGFGCTGKNLSPPLSWKDAPAGTKSFAVTVYDPDAPTGSGWWHWIIFNIPAGVNNLAENAGDPASGLAPKGSIQSRTDYGKPGYGGPCPPAGDKPHRYLFTVFALDTPKIDLDANASGAMAGYFLNQHALAKATLTGYYSR